jgi:cytosine/adenosine deaminase-related metal-dependent hydrolase
MRYRKFSADYLFTGEDFLPGKKVLITDAGGLVLDLVSPGEAGEEVEYYPGILSPGFINAHCHLELSHLKGRIPEKTGLADFVCNVVSGRHLDEDRINGSIVRAEEEMADNGIVAAGDICNNISTVARKAEGNLRYHNFIEVSGWLPSLAAIRFEKSKDIYDDFVKNGLRASIIPHAPYSVSGDLWKMICPFFRDTVVSIHNQETPGEDLFFLEGKGDLTRMYQMMKMDISGYLPPGKRSVMTYFEKFGPASSAILVHNTFTRQEDLDFIQAHKKQGQLVSFCLCPNANAYIENTLPDVELFLRNGCHIVLGTDSLASNHQLSILEEVKTIRGKYPGIPTASLLQWATLNGARALQLDADMGSFTKGKKPGILWIRDTSGPEITARSGVSNLLKTARTSVQDR